MRTIADHLSKLHSVSFYCGNLFDRVFVQLPELYVTFPFPPEEPDNDDELRVGICNDTIQFRHVVSILLQNECLMFDNNNELKALPTEFNFFFSEVFLRGLCHPDLEIVKEHSLFQLYHPATYDSVDRIKFLHLIIIYRNKSFRRFITVLDLSNPAYMLSDWQSRFNAGSSMHKILLKTLPDYYIGNTNACGCIPSFIRNVHHHFGQQPGDKVFIFKFVIYIYINYYYFLFFL